MNIYFVRHGESILNQSDMHQFSDTKLSPRGVQQALAAAKTLRSIQLDVIYSSPQTRALQTASIIAKEKNMEVTQNDLLRELKRPSEIEGRPTKEDKVIEIKQMLTSHMFDSTWHFSDEENMTDLYRRAIQVVDFISSQEKENILIVSHGVIIRMTLLCMLFPKQDVVHLFDDFYLHTYIGNTGMLQCRSTSSGFSLIL